MIGTDEPYVDKEVCIYCLRLEDLCRTCFIDAVEEEIAMQEWLRNATDGV